MEAALVFNKKKDFLQVLLGLIFVSFFSNILVAQNNKTFTVGSIEAEQGEVAKGCLSIEKGIDEGTFIPITIINGAKSGPVLTLVAGIHGTEYVPIITAQKLVKEITPEELSGTLIIVHIANIPAFSSRSDYSSPIDYKNLNRIFPGKIDGTVSERIAFILSNEIMSKSDYYIDMHGGEFNERIIDYLYFYYGCPDGDLCKKSYQLAHAMGNKYLFPDKYNSVPDSLPSGYSDLEAFRRGVASITLEWGDQGAVKPEEIDKALKGIKNVMKTIGMLEGKPFINENPVYLINEKLVSSNYDGILFTFVDRAQYITKGTLIGYTTDYWGNVLEEYHSPISGIVVVVKICPSINKGESVFRIAEPVDEYKE